MNNFGKMTRVLLDIFVLSLVLVLTLSYPQQETQLIGQRNGNPRSNRGFQIQNAKLSTARGFGKRGGVEESMGSFGVPISRGQGRLETNLQFGSDAKPNIPNNWLVEEIQVNPETARLIIEKYLNENKDGELTADEILRKTWSN